MTLSGLHVCSGIFLLWKLLLSNYLWIARRLHWICLIRYMVLKITFSDMTRDCDRKQWVNQPQRRINITMHLRWRLLGSGIETCAIYWKSMVILEVYIYYIPQRTKPSQFSLSKVNPIQLENLICMFHLNNQLLTRSNKLFQKKHTSKCG